MREDWLDKKTRETMLHLIIMILLYWVKQIE